MKKTTAITISLLISCIAFSQNIIDNFSGEYLKYRAKYGFITGGAVTIETKSAAYKNDTNCYDVTIDMYATGIVDDLFHFHDIFRSTFSKETLKPHVFIRDAHEGKYVQYEEVYYYDDHVESTVKGRFETKERYYDVVSGIFALRSMDWSNWAVNTQKIFPIYFNEKVFDVNVTYKGKETIKINKKEYSCHKFMPVFTGTKMFKKNGLSIYFTDDNKRIPVLIKVDFAIGNFKVELMEIK
jgi:hypothetical protein